MKSDDDEKMQDIVENQESLNATSDDEDDGQDEADEKRRAEHAQLVQQQQEKRDFNYNILPRFTDALRDLITNPQSRISNLEDSIKYFKCIIPKVVCRSPQLLPTHIDTQFCKTKAYERFAY